MSAIGPSTKPEVSHHRGQVSRSIRPDERQWHAVAGFETGLVRHVCPVPFGGSSLHLAKGRKTSGAERASTVSRAEPPISEMFWKGAGITAAHGCRDSCHRLSYSRRELSASHILQVKCH
jgi:hypothetical protein